MTALNTTWSPNSFQLRLALNSWKSPAIFVRVRVRKLDRQVRVLSVAGDSAGSGREVKEPSIGNSWINSNSSADDVSGWSGADEGKQSNGSERKSWFGGIAGAGVAGIILVAALTFATSSVSKRKSSKLAQGMEPLTTQQETILAADDQNDRVVQDENEGKDMLRDDGGVSKAGIDNDSSSSTENNEATNENRQSGPDMACTINSDDAINSTSMEDDLQNEAATDDMLVVPHVSSGTTILPDSESEYSSFVVPNAENSYGDLITERSEQAIELKENLIDSELTNFSVSNANPADLNTDHHDGVPELNTTEYSNFSFASSFNSIVDISNKPPPLDNSDDLPLDTVLEPQSMHNEIIERVDSASTGEDTVLNKEHVSAGANMSLTEEDNLNEDGAMGQTSVSTVANPFANEQDASTYNSINESTSSFESTNPGNSFSSAGIPAPSVVSAALQVVPGKVLVPAVVDQVQGQALSALQVLKVIEAEVQPGDLCTRREYARWLVSTSSTLSRNTASKVYPAMYIENVTELAFDDITPEDPDFPSIQGLAEAGLISSKLSRRDMSPLDEDPSSLSFFPESPLSRQDLVSWKMALEKRQLPEAKRKILHQFSGFLDIDKINPDAWPALLADVSAGENGIIALAFGFTRLFQPEKPVTKAQAAIALATGEASDIVSEELARIEAESMAENAVAAHTALVAQVEKDVNASFEKELLLEREKVNTVERLAEEARQELERLKAERERDGITLMKERAAVESEMEVLARLRHEVAEQMESLMSNKAELSFEKERLSKLLKEAEFENQEITRLQHELEVERKALSMARSWAEDEAKRAREQAKILEEARDRWESRGIKIVVDNDLREEENVGVTWLDASKQFTVEGSINRAESLVDKLKAMAADVRGKAKITISKIIQKMLSLISVLKEWASRAIQQGGELKDAAMLKMSDSLRELQQSSAGFTLSIKEGATRVAEDCKEGVEKLTHKFKT